MTSPADIDGLAGLFYEAVLDTRKWQEALHALVQVAGARGASFSRADLSVPTNTLLDVVGQSTEAIEAYSNHYVHMDPLLRLGEVMRSGEWVSDWAVLGPGYARSAYYNEFMRPHENHAVLVASLWEEGPHSAFIALQRSRRQGEFPAHAAGVLQAVLPHLRRAARLHFNTVQLRAHAEFAAETLHRIATPVIVLEGDGRVLLANTAGEHLCRASKLLNLTNNRLVAVFQDAALQKALKDATVPGRGRPTWLRLASTAGEEALLVVVTPMGASAAQGRQWQRPLAVLMASRSSASARKVDTVLRDLFGLTAAEARVAAGIADGLSPSDIAQRYGIAVLTVRGQLKAVYSKMGVRRQAELSRMLMKLQGLLPRQSASE